MATERVWIEVMDCETGDSFTITSREQDARVGMIVYALFPDGRRRAYNVVGIARHEKGER